AFQHVDDALQFTVMMSAGLGVGMDSDGAGPDLLGTGPCVVDGRGAVHPRSLCCVWVEGTTRNDFHAMLAPMVRFGRVLVMIVRHGRFPVSVSGLTNSREQWVREPLTARSRLQWS